MLAPGCTSTCVVTLSIALCTSSRFAVSTVAEWLLAFSKAVHARRLGQVLCCLQFTALCTTCTLSFFAVVSFHTVVPDLMTFLQLALTPPAAVHQPQPQAVAGVSMQLQASPQEKVNLPPVVLSLRRVVLHVAVCASHAVSS